MLLNFHHLQVPTEPGRKDMVKERAAQLSHWDPETSARSMQVQRREHSFESSWQHTAVPWQGPTATGNLDTYISIRFDCQMLDH